MVSKIEKYSSNDKMMWWRLTSLFISEWFNSEEFPSYIWCNLLKDAIYDFKNFFSMISKSNHFLIIFLHKLFLAGAFYIKTAWLWRILIVDLTKWIESCRRVLWFFKTYPVLAVKCTFFVLQKCILLRHICFKFEKIMFHLFWSVFSRVCISFLCVSYDLLVNGIFITLPDNNIIRKYHIGMFEKCIWVMKYELKPYPYLYFLFCMFSLTF